MGLARAPMEIATSQTFGKPSPDVGTDGITETMNPQCTKLDPKREVMDEMCI